MAAQRELKRRWRFDSYDAALKRWIATVAVIEVGYDGEWEEYAGLELAARDYLEELMVLSPGSREKVEEDLRIWDERFRAATVEEEEPHLSCPGWWWSRSPAKWRNPSLEEKSLEAAALAHAPPGARVAGLSISRDGSYGAVLTLLPPAGNFAMDDLFERVGDPWTSCDWRYAGGATGGGVVWSAIPGGGVLRWSAEAPPDSRPVTTSEERKYVLAPRVWIAYEGRETYVHPRGGWFYLVVWDTEYTEEPRVVRFEPSTPF